MASFDTHIAYDQPLAWYKLASGARTVDSSGNGNTLTEVGTNFTQVKSIVPSIGTSDGACRFDNNTLTGVLNPVDSTPFKFTGNAAFSVECWFIPNFVSAGYLRLCTWDDENNASTNCFGILYQSGLISGFRRVNGTDNLAYWNVTPIVGYTYHAVFTYDGTDMRFYCNRELRHTVGDTSTQGTYGGNFVIGGGQFGGNSAPADIDEFCVYDYKLEEARIFAHFDAARVPGNYPIYAQTY